MRLANKVALVTNAGNTIGEAIGLRLAEEGAAVVAAHADADQARRVAEMIWAEGGQALPLQQDINCQASWDAVIRACTREFGSLNILVCNFQPDGLETAVRSMQAGSPGDEQDQFKKALLGIRAGINVMKSAGGSIINLSDTPRRAKCAGEYAKGKKSITEQLLRSAAMECTKGGFAVRINAVGVENGLSTLVSRPSPRSYTRALRGQAREESFNLQDLANAVVFLASEESRCINGTEFFLSASGMHGHPEFATGRLPEHKRT